MRAYLRNEIQRNARQDRAIPVPDELAHHDALLRMVRKELKLLAKISRLISRPPEKERS
jgi:hypothetical protein